HAAVDRVEGLHRQHRLGGRVGGHQEAFRLLRYQGGGGSDDAATRGRLRYSGARELHLSGDGRHAVCRGLPGEVPQTREGESAGRTKPAAADRQAGPARGNRTSRALPGIGRSTIRAGCGVLDRRRLDRGLAQPPCPPEVARTVSPAAPEPVPHRCRREPERSALPKARIFHFHWTGSYGSRHSPSPKSPCTSGFRYLPHRASKAPNPSRPLAAQTASQKSPASRLEVASAAQLS